MPAIDFRVLRAAIALDAVLKLSGFVCLQRRGGQARGSCPIHAPKRTGGRSFSACLDRNVYRCFHCGSAGNQLDLWAAVTRQPLHQAAIDLCEKLRRPVPWLSLPQKPLRTIKSAPAS